MERLWGSAPSAEACKGLGSLRNDDARFTDTYEATAHGLAAYWRDAVRLWADRHLA